MSPTRPTSKSWRAVLAAVTSALMIAAFALVGVSPAQAAGGGTIAGTVSDHLGDPLAGVNVSFGDGTIVPDVLTDVNGEYVSGELPENTYRVAVYDSTLTYWPQEQQGVSVTAGAVSFADDFTLALRPNYVLHGQVTDAVSGDPVANMQVTAWGPDFTVFHPVTAETDANGFYELTHIPVSTVTVGVDDYDAVYKVWQLQNVALGAEPTTLNIALTLKPTGIGEISGVVLERGTTTPIEGAQLSASTTDGFMESLITGPDGSYTFTGVPMGLVTIYAMSPWNSPEPPVYQSNSVSVALSASTPVRVRDIPLKRAPVGVSSVSGTLTEADGAGGSIPLADFFVSAMSTNMSSPGGMPVTTDATGNFSIGSLANGTYYLSVMPVDFSLRDAFKPLDFPALVFTVDGVNSVTKNLELVRYPSGTGSISGVLTDRRTAEPIGGANVSIWRADGTLSRFTTTDTLGQWSIGNLPDGEYEFGVSSFQHEYQWTWPRFTIVDGGHVDRASTLNSVAAGTASLSGRVKNFATHAGVAGAGVMVDRIEGGFESKAVVADANGDYVVTGLPAGSFRVQIDADGFESGFGAVDIAAGEAAAYTGRLVPSAPVPTGEGTVSGTVTDSLGDPVQGAMVSATPSTGASLGQRGWASTTTDADGQYEMDSLPLMKLSVTVGAPGFASASRTATLAVDSADQVHDFVLEDAASLSGIVTTDDGSVPAGVQAMLYSPDGQPWWGVPVSDNGTYTIDSLPSGDYILRLFQSIEVSDGTDTPSIRGAYWMNGSSTGTQDQASATVVHIAPGDELLGHDIRLQSGGTIAGTVRVATPDGTTALPQGKSVKVTAYKLEGAVWTLQELAYTYAYSGSNGTYQLVGLAPGSYKLQFSDDWAGNRAYLTTFNGGSDALSDAPVLTVAAGATNGGIDAAVSVPTPAAASSAVTTADLGSSTEGQVGAPSDASNGEEITVNVGSELAGEFVSVWAHSTPTPLTGWVKVASDGTVKATVASSLPAGQHHLVVQDAEDAVVGWSEISVSKAGAPSAPGAGGGSGSGAGAAAGAGSAGGGTPFPGRPTGSAAFDVVAETFGQSMIEETATPNDVKSAPEASTPDKAATESSAADPISAEDGGPNWTLLLGLLAGVVAIGAVGGVVATVRARRG